MDCGIDEVVGEKSLGMSRFEENRMELSAVAGEDRELGDSDVKLTAAGSVKSRMERCLRRDARKRAGVRCKRDDEYALLTYWIPRPGRSCGSFIGQE